MKRTDWRFDLRSVLCALSLGAAALAANAADWPSRPIKLVVPSAPGGGADTLARLYVNQIQGDLTQPIVMDYKPGAGGVLAAQSVKSTVPDGHTLFITNTSILGANLFLYKSLTYDPVADFTHIGMIAASGSVALVSAKSSMKSLPALIAHARENPGKVSFGYYASSSRIPAEVLKARAGVDILGVPYKNITQITTDLMGGQISFAFLDYGSAAAAIGASTLVPIADTGTRPFPLWPDVPTLSSMYDGLVFGGFYGLSAPKGTPKAVVDQLAKSIAKAQAQPAFRAQMQKLGYLPVNMTPQQFTDAVKALPERWGPWMKAAGIEPQ
ncbi:Bug family tripartite tricarboxylate transporter substrate binding protein [Ottowia thiooxydans]|uniref:Bug family tripartite tricarboxylate transporter substrate binding protein n=1 Tax=Ottowia thiooxydans TaxID=219182 RepID=UPI0003F50DCF|nr:tripartite tricarboxylate transporter substrate binding protein [Ottowia thiooxydans]